MNPLSKAVEVLGLKFVSSMILTGQNKKKRTTIILAFNLPVNQTVTPDFLLIKKKK